MSHKKRNDMTKNEAISKNRNAAFRFLVTAAFAATLFSGSAVAAGEDTYKAKCVGCHGPDGSGSTVLGKKLKLRDLRSADVQKQSDAELQAIVAKGKPPMPAFEKTLDAAAVQQVVAYLRSIATK